MRAIAIVLLIGVFVANDTANWLANGSRFTPAAVFYMLQGTWVAVLSACLLMLIAASKASLWRNLACAALVISIVEAIEIPVCRFAVKDIKDVPRGVNICDHVTGLPIGTVTTVLAAAIIAWMIGRHFASHAD